MWECGGLRVWGVGCGGVTILVELVVVGNIMLVFFFFLFQVGLGVGEYPVQGRSFIWVTRENDLNKLNRQRQNYETMKK